MSRRLGRPEISCTTINLKMLRAIGRSLLALPPPDVPILAFPLALRNDPDEADIP